MKFSCYFAAPNKAEVSQRMQLWQPLDCVMSVVGRLQGKGGCGVLGVAAWNVLHAL